MTRLARYRDWLRSRPLAGDLAAILLLVLLWGLFFWRALTPNPADQVSLPQGDFSGQFLAFGAYQARRLLAGQIPLWNPYNYAGAPFLADTQSAVFYPPRLLAIFVSQFVGGWNYGVLQGEVLAHYLLVSFFMYAFMRVTTSSRIAALTSSLAVSYGGYMTGYPPLQVAVLEAGVWLPLGLLGIYKASDLSQQPTEIRWQLQWLAVTSLALGFSLLAGHPQTSLYLTYALIAYMAHRAFKQRVGWRQTALAMAGTLAAGYGLAAVQVIPGLEYSSLTTRTDIGFDARAGGFPFSDLATILVPNVFSVWSPLYSGIPVVGLALIAFWRRENSSRFWGYLALIALVLSFGGATLAYQFAYLAVPGLALFRGQERAAYLISYAAAIMAGHGTLAVMRNPASLARARRPAGVVTTCAWLAGFELLIVRAVWPGPLIDRLTQAVFFMAILTTLSLYILSKAQAAHGPTLWMPVLLGLIVFDLFSNNMRTNWEQVPLAKRVLLSNLVPIVQADPSLFRVDGRLGLGENYGTMTGLQDIRGTSPLRLKSLDAYNTLPDYRLYQLLNVKYVFTDWIQLETPSTILGVTQLGTTTARLHKLADPLPRAWMVYRVMTTTDQNEALGWLSDPSFDPSLTVILTNPPASQMPRNPPDHWLINILQYEPEHIVLDALTPQNGVLVLSEMDYPGWVARVNGVEQPIALADAGLRALVLRAGQYRIELSYDPLSFKVGAALTTVSAFLVLSILGLAGIRNRPLGKGTHDD